MNERIYFSPAKINLFLEVLSKRVDGYHNINSLMCLCNVGDYLKITENSKFELNIDGPFKVCLQNMTQNIILNVFEIFKKKFSLKKNIKITLYKNLPISSGIGGGSSNAATAFKCFENFFKLQIDKKLRDNILLSIGADVPFCYHGKPSLVSGIGDKIKSIKFLPDFFILLVNPLIKISTKEIFQKIKNFSSKKTFLPNKEVSKNTITDILINSNNDLESLVVKKYPEIGKILNLLKKDTNSLLTRMSGSGSTCFALFDSEKELTEAYLKISELKKNCWIEKGKILNKI